MLTISRLKYLYLAYFSKPASDRAIYRAIRRQKVARILEIGLGDGQRARRVIRLAQQSAGDQPVRYVAIDLFEARGVPAGGHLSLKDAHRLLKATGAQVQLIPGDPAGALARSANALQNMDLILLSAEHDEQALAGGWFYLPRMLHARSMMLVESACGDGPKTVRVLSRSEIEERAVACRPRRAA